MKKQVQKQVKTDRKVVLLGKTASTFARLIVISVEGIGVVSPRGAPVGTTLETRFELPAFSRFKTFNLIGTVTHRHNAGDDIYLYLKFSKLNNNDRLALQDFIDYKNRLSQYSKDIRHYN